MGLFGPNRKLIIHGDFDLGSPLILTSSEYKYVISKYGSLAALSSILEKYCSSIRKIEDIRDKFDEVLRIYPKYVAEKMNKTFTSTPITPHIAGTSIMNGIEDKDLHDEMMKLQQDSRLTLEPSMKLLAEMSRYQDEITKFKEQIKLMIAIADDIIQNVGPVKKGLAEKLTSSSWNSSNVRLKKIEKNIRDFMKFAVVYNN